MSVTNDVATDRRVLRHAATLSEAGAMVTVVGRRLRDSLPVEGDVACHRMRLLFRRGVGFYAEYNIRLMLYLLVHRCDLVYANDIDTMPACRMAACLKRKPLVMDVHELFPEVPELVDRPKVKLFWQRLDDRMMPRANVRITVCDSLAHYYRQRLGVDLTVVRNIAPRHEVVEVEKREPAHDNLKVLLYQGCVNKGRGVDWAIDAMGLLPDCRLVIAGGGDLLEAMKLRAQATPWADRITFTGRLSPDQLAQLTPTADVGLVMLEDMGLSYHMALPNRIGDFVAAGVPLVVSDLPEMARAVRLFRIGDVMEAPGPEALASSVHRVLQRRWSAADFAAARADMDWNVEKTKLTDAVGAALTKQQTQNQ